MRRSSRRLARYAALSAVVTLVAVPVSVALDPAQRPAVIRMAAAVIVGVMLIDLIRVVRALFEAQPPSAFGAALEPVTSPPSIDRGFREARDELRGGAASEIYFSRVLWPRLLALADRVPGRPSLAPPARSRVRRLLRRGPSLAALRDLIAALEGRA
jgi:hypothetical protein